MEFITMDYIFTRNQINDLLYQISSLALEQNSDYTITMSKKNDNNHFTGFAKLTIERNTFHKKYFKTLFKESLRESLMTFNTCKYNNFYYKSSKMSITVTIEFTNKYDITPDKTFRIN